MFDIRTSVHENHMSWHELAEAGITPESVASLLRTESAGGWIAVDGDQAVGFSMARADIGDVFALFVRPGLEGRGIGSDLLEEAETWLARRGRSQAWLVTGGEPALRAARFYRRRGWVDAGLEADGQIRFTKHLGTGIEPATHYDLT